MIAGTADTEASSSARACLNSIFLKTSLASAMTLVAAPYAERANFTGSEPCANAQMP
jgi:hypothetical protein